MTETFTALLLAHVLADFVFQSREMAEGKQARRALPLLMHIVIVAAAATLALGPVTPEAAAPVLLLALAHLVIDLGKSFAPPGRLAPFLLDQAAHLGSLAAVAWAWPGLYGAGLWAGPAWLPATMALAAGLIAASRAGGFAVGLLMAPYGEQLKTQADADEEINTLGLLNGGMIIGVLERGLVFLFVLSGQPAAIGFLIAAKSILRFDTAKDLSAGEYVIIGTLASFGWALLAAYATLWLMAALPPLGIPPLTP